MTLLCIGLSHREASIAVREQVAVPFEQLAARLQSLKTVPGIREAMLLSTCNRLEVYAVAESRAQADDLARLLGVAAQPHLRIQEGDEALKQLFRVAASLDSMVVGEAQILGQIKEAFTAAQACGAAGPELTLVFARATAAARRVRSETEIARGAVSVSSVAVQLARKLLGNLSGRTVLLVGAGEMAQLAAKELRSDGARELYVANRSIERAEELARECQGVPVSLAELPSLLERSDVVLASTGASQALITREMMARAMKARRFQPVFLIDLALPRNVEPAVNELENVYVYDMDDLERVASQNRELREGHVGRAEQIVLEELRAHAAALHERKAVPVLARLRAQAEAIARAEAEKTLGSLAGLSEKQQKSVQAMANAIVNKLLHEPTARLRAEAGAGPLGDAAAELFGLDAEEPPAEKEEERPALKLARND